MMSIYKDDRYDPEKLMQIGANFCKKPYAAVKRGPFQKMLFDFTLQVAKSENDKRLKKEIEGKWSD